MWQRGVVHSRQMHPPGVSPADRRLGPARRATVPASLRWRRPPSGLLGSMRRRHGQHLRPLALRKAAPDAVGLVHLQRVRPAGGHRRTFEAHSFGLRLAAGSRRPAFALRMEEERTRHSPAGCVQLPIPEISIRAGKAPGVRHVDPHFDHPIVRCDTTGDLGAVGRAEVRPGSSFVTATEGNCLVGLPRPGRIRADLGDVDLQTLDRFSALDKTLITIFFDLDLAAARPGPPALSNGRHNLPRPLIHETPDHGFITGEWRRASVRLLSAVNTRSIEG